MRVLFNATAALDGTSGAVHTVGLLSHLARAAPQHEFILLTTPDQDFLRQRLAGVVGSHVAEGLGTGSLSRTARLQWRLGRIGHAVGADFIYNKGNFHAIGTRRQVCFIENSNPFSTLRLKEPLWYRLRNRLLRGMSDYALGHAAACILPTEHTRRLVAQRSPTTAPTFVVPYGWELPPAAERTPMQRPYVLCVSSILPYKNLPLLADAVDLLVRRGTFDADLAIVGVSKVAGSTPYYRKFVQRLTARGLDDRVRLLPPVPPAELAALYRDAACVAMPSLEESFGIPLIEAMGLGAPVAAARVSAADRDRYFISFDEICGDAAEYFDPFDVESCAGAIARTLEPQRRALLAEKGVARAEQFSWTRAAEKTLAVFESLRSL